jgi:hypothetical protein
MWLYKNISHIQVWLLFYFFSTSPIKLKIKNTNTWETTNNKPPGPIIMIAWSETTESNRKQSVAAGVSQIVSLLVGTRDLRTLWGANATCQPLPFLSYREKEERRPSSGTWSYLYLDSFFDMRLFDFAVRFPALANCAKMLGQNHFAESTGMLSLFFIQF